MWHHILKFTSMGIKNKNKHTHEEIYISAEEFINQIKIWSGMPIVKNEIM